MTVRPVSTGAAEYELSDQQLFSDSERELLTRVVSLAEHEGKTVDLLVGPGVDPFDAMVQTAANLKASRLVTGYPPHGLRRTGAAGSAWPGKSFPSRGTVSRWRSLPRASFRRGERRPAPTAFAAAGPGSRARPLAAPSEQVRFEMASARRRGPSTPTAGERPRRRARPGRAHRFGTGTGKN